MSFMKKSWSVIAIVAIALVFGLLVGTKLFNSGNNNDGTVVVVSGSTKSQGKELELNHSNQVSKASLKDQKTSVQGPVSKLMAIANTNLNGLDKSCEEEFLNIYPTDDFLDQKSDVFSEPQSYELGLMLLNKILDTVMVSQEFDQLSDEIYRQGDFDPNVMRTLMPHGVVCNDVKYTNFMHALVRSLGHSNSLTPELKRKYINNILDMAERFVSGFKRMEYTFSAMEYLYALVDNELIPREYAGELSQIRQDIIRYTSDFEGEYRLENAAEVNRELLRTYRDANELTNESIELLIDRIRADIPG